MIRLLLGICASTVAWAHVVSMSSGAAAIEGRTMRYELRMPAYETAHIPSAEKTLFEHIAFASAGHPARLVSSSCRTENDSFACTAAYEFPVDVDRLEITCSFPDLGIPTHVHLLRATKDGKTAQTAFDASFRQTELEFHPPSPAELAVRQAAAGFRDAAISPAVWMLLIAIALGLKQRRDAAVAILSLAAGLTAASLLLPRLNWQPTLRFGEAAAALAACYAAFEVALQPGSGLRWFLIAALGALQSLRVRYFLFSLDYPATFYLAGDILLAALVVGSLGALVWMGKERWPNATRLVRPIAGTIVAMGLAWFALQL